MKHEQITIEMDLAVLPHLTMNYDDVDSQYNRKEAIAAAINAMTNEQVRALAAERGIIEDQETITKPTAWEHHYRKIGGGRVYSQADYSVPPLHPDPDPGYEWVRASPLFADLPATLNSSIQPPPVKDGIVLSEQQFAVLLRLVANGDRPWILREIAKDARPIFGLAPTKGE